MPRRPHRPSVDQVSYVYLSDIATALGMTTDELKKFVGAHGYLLTPIQRSRIGMRQRYPVRWIEEIRELTGQAYEEADPASDWLARFIKEGPDATT